MNICFCNTNEAWGGGEKWHFEMSRSLGDQGHAITVIAYKNSPFAQKCREKNIEVKEIKISNLAFLNPVLMISLYLFFRKKNFDAIILNLPRDVKTAATMGKWAKINKIIYRRGMPHPLRKTLLNKYLFTKVITHIIANSLEIKRSLLKHVATWNLESKISILFNGVTPRSSMESALHTPLILGNAGRLVEQKGQKYLLELADELSKQNFSFKMLIAGTGPLENKLKEHDKIELLGHLNDMESFYQQIDFFLFPSLYEGMPNALIEAMNHQKVCFAFDTSAMPEVIDHQKNGFLLEVGDIKTWAKLIIDLAAHPQNISQLQKSALEKVQTTFSWEKKVKQMEELLHD